MQLRVIFHDPAQPDNPANIWVTAEPPQGAEWTVRLQHDYPDWQPAPGMKVHYRGRLFSVTAVNGREVTCSEETNG